MNCEKHQMKRDYLFCLDQTCRDRLTCMKCYMRDQKHNGHNYVNIKSFMRKDEDQLARIFNTTLVQNIKQEKTLDQLMELFDNGISQLM